MALTQSARLPGPSWEEEVVPALRKRLQSESRTLAHRMSAASISSLEDPAHNPQNNYAYYEPVQTRSAHARQPSTSSKALRSTQPRSQTPQNHQQTPQVNGAGYSASASSGPQTPRARTYSSPRINGTTTPTMSAKDRSASPRQQSEPKPTRIPKPARRRADSTSSHAYAGSPQSPYTPPLPTPSAERWAVEELHAASSSESTLSVNITRQRSGILNEQPPFPPGSAASSHTHWIDGLDDYAARPSTESEEQPYEHWYRGEVSRNGGVGELRVAKRMEMLEIANYGHKPSQQQLKDKNAYTDAINARKQQRKRAGSLGPEMTTRESFYMDEEGAREAARVMDEGPLTDIDADTSEGGPIDLSTSSEPLPTSSSSYDLRSTTPMIQDNRRQRMATPTKNARAPQMARGQSEPPFPTSSSNTSTPTSRKSPTSLNQTKRGVSPAPLSASKKARTEASKATRAKMEAARRQAEKNRRSVAHYPKPPEDGNDLSMEDAIPEWTQPKPKTGNWDDVVLPAVARKKGLDEYYEMVDGSPKQIKQEPAIEPAPGTFGYDYSKYRPPRDDESRPIPMDEFGRPSNSRPGPVPEDDDTYAGRPKPMSSNPYDETPVGSQRGPPQDVPFERYHNDVGRDSIARGSTKLHPISQNAMKMEMAQPEPDDASAGCCKCVIM